MEILRIEATDKTPFVCLNAQTGKLEISGKSIPQDAETFYAPILSWMESYVEQPAHYTEVILNLEYFNISSSKRILFLLYKLNELADKSVKVNIKWFYAENDDDMKEVGQDFAFMVKVPFEFINKSTTSVVS
jgi:sulfur relay (sulfurtransferase) DsrC/TusE family protein